ncbi:MAG TPA: cbb3-type cytochrome c oxidase subunit I [Nitrososphaerales archaeon]|nr:cbb3-type cytochrome c oxidase subunit I [Nitrososphaerales archaeon]
MGATEWLRRWITTTNHKDIGLLYLFTSLYFGMAGGALALLMRVQLSVPDNNFLSAIYYDQAVTMHGLIMIFWFLSPLAVAFFNYLVPLQIGAKDLAFPRLNALSYWLFLSGGILAISSFFVPGGAAASGWTTYQPLSSPSFQPGPGPTLVYVGLLLLAVSVTLGSVNIITSILWMRTKGMGFTKLPMFTWFALFTTVAMLYAFPTLIAAFALNVSDRIIGTSFFTSPAILSVPGIDPSILWDDLFWFFGHPEVYIVLLPAFGVISDIIPSFTGRPIAGRNWILISTALVVLPLSFGVWMHHMFLTGIPVTLQDTFDVSTEAISIPFGIIIIAFVLSLVRGRIQFKTPFLFVLGAVVLFIIGGLMGVFLSSPVLDREFNGSYFVVSHFHYVMVGATIFGLIAAIYYWLPRMTGRMYKEAIGRAHFVISFIGFNVLYAPMMLLSDMPRRIFTYPNAGDLGILNEIATVGAFIFIFAQVLLAYNVVHTWFRGTPSGPNPWGSSDLEWKSDAEERTPAVGEVAPRGGWIGQLTNSTPEVSGVSSGSGEGHGGHTSIRPFALGLGATLFFFGVPFYPSAAGVGAMVVGAFLVLYTLFSWAKDDIKEKFSVPDEGEERFPFSALPKVKLGMWVFLSSEVILFGTLIGAYLFIREAVVGWPLPSTIHNIPLGTANTIILLSSGFTMAMAVYSIKKGNQRGLLLWLMVTFVLGSIFMGIKISEWTDLASAGFTLTSPNPLYQLVASTYYFLVGLHGAHVTAGLIVMVYLMKKTLSGAYTKDSHGAIENFGLYWAFVDIVWCFIFPLFYLL